MSRLRPNKLLVFQLRGGPRGFRLIQGNISDDPDSAAHALWALTQMGTVGRQFNWCDKDGDPHNYKVVDKSQDTEAIIVTCEFVSSVDSPAV
jgi:hypothetical protein